MPKMWRAVLAAVMGSLVLSGCSGDGPATAEPPVGLLDDEEGGATPDPALEPDHDQEPEPQPEPDLGSDPGVTDDESDGDLYAIPEGVDAGYVDLVMNHLVNEANDVLVDILSRGEGEPLTAENLKVLESINSGPRLSFVLQDLEEFAASAERRTSVYPSGEIGRTSWTTVMVMEAESGCIVAAGYQDLSEVAISHDPRVGGLLVSLSSSEVNGNNPTGWTIQDITPITSGGEPVPEESWEGIEYWDVLDTSCDEQGRR